MSDKVREAFAAGAAAQREAAAAYIEATEITELLKSGDKQMIQLVVDFVRFYSWGIRNMPLVVDAYSCTENAEKCTRQTTHVQKTAESVHAPQRDATDPAIQTITLQAKENK